MSFVGWDSAERVQSQRKRQGNKALPVQDPFAFLFLLSVSAFVRPPLGSESCLAANKAIAENIGIFQL